jgi:hypothetical protein
MQNDAVAEQPASAENQKSPAPLSNEEAKKAAEVIQRTYRGHRRRRELQGLGLSASTRWDEVHTWFAREGMRMLTADRLSKMRSISRLLPLERRRRWGRSLAPL